MLQAPYEGADAQRTKQLDGIAKNWLQTLLYNAGCIDHEQDILRLTPPSFQ
jgi:hypothetical protein